MNGRSVRKVQLTVERVHHDGGPALAQRVVRGAIAAVVANPFSGRHHDDLMPFTESSGPLGVPDAPRPDEVVYALVMTTGPRPHHRIGGFTIDEVVGDNGLR